MDTESPGPVKTSITRHVSQDASGFSHLTEGHRKERRGEGVHGSVIWHSVTIGIANEGNPCPISSFPQGGFGVFTEVQGPLGQKVVSEV